MAFDSADGVVVWVINRKKRARRFRKNKRDNIRLQYSPSGRYLAVANSKAVPTEVWDLDDWKAETPLAKVSFKRISRSGLGGSWNDFSLVGGGLIAVTEDGSVKFVDLNTGDIKRTVTIPKSG